MSASNGQSSDRATSPLAGFLGSAGFLSQVLRYGVVAVIAACVDTGVLWLLNKPLKVQYLVAGLAGFVCGLAVNFLLARRFVFGATKLSPASELGAYAVIGVIGLGLTELILFIGIGGFGAYVLVAKAAALVIVFFWNFLARRYLIYRVFGSA